MSDLVRRLRGQYAIGPHLTNGDPEFGWRQFEATPINLEAAVRIEELEATVRGMQAEIDRMADQRLDMALALSKYASEENNG